MVEKIKYVYHCLARWQSSILEHRLVVFTMNEFSVHLVMCTVHTYPAFFQKMQNVSLF